MFLNHVFPRSGAFDVTLPLDYDEDADWIFLLDGTGDMHVTFVGAGSLTGGNPGCQMLDHDLVLDSCTLIIEYDESVPATHASWGALKVIYR